MNHSLKTTLPVSLVEDLSEVTCIRCGSYIEPVTLALTGDSCRTCRDKAAERLRRAWCVAPISNKAAYTLITDLSLLKQINPKRTET